MRILIFILIGMMLGIMNAKADTDLLQAVLYDQDLSQALLYGNTNSEPSHKTYYGDYQGTLRRVNNAYQGHIYNVERGESEYVRINDSGRINRIGF